MTETPMTNLHVHIEDHVNCGAINMNHALGSRSMPEGYALMLNADQTHYYWLRHDGAESTICWDRWAAYRGAKQDHRYEQDIQAVLDLHEWRLVDRGDGVMGHYCIACTIGDGTSAHTAYWNDVADDWTAFGSLYLSRRRAQQRVLTLASRCI